MARREPLIIVSNRGPVGFRRGSSGAIEESRGAGGLVTADPEHTLGSDVAARFHRRLPFLLKLIAPARPLSLQVHPDLARAREMFATEEAAGVAVDSPRRNYKDANHKPELVYALSRFEALCGFRAPRRAAELLAGLDTPVTDRLHAMLRAEPDTAGVKRAFTSLLNLVTRPEPAAVAAVAAACARRLETGSPSDRADRTVEDGKPVMEYTE